MLAINSKKLGLFLYSIFGVLGLLAAPMPGVTEHLCHSSVSFLVKKTQDEAEQEVFWARIERKGSDEAVAKAALAEAIASETPKALAGCRESHENLAGCVASKFSALSSTLQRLSFTQRKSIEDAINADCNARQGRCGAVKSSEPSCSLLASASSSSAAADAKDTKKKK